MEQIRNEFKIMVLQIIQGLSTHFPQNIQFVCLLYICNHFVLRRLVHRLLFLFGNGDNQPSLSSGSERSSCTLIFLQRPLRTYLQFILQDIYGFSVILGTLKGHPGNKPSNSLKWASRNKNRLCPVCNLQFSVPPSHISCVTDDYSSS